MSDTDHQSVVYVSSSCCVEPIVSTMRAYQGAALQIITPGLIIIYSLYLP